MDHVKPAVIGLGYVGLPLAVAISGSYDVVGFDVNEKRILSLKVHEDVTNEVSVLDLQSATRCNFTSSKDELKDCNFYIVTVPTPIDDANRPDLTSIISATETLSEFIKKNDIIVYESTVYPGVTEEICGPIIEQITGLKLNVDFYLGYSPERINPGDKVHTVTEITKVTSGSTPEAAEEIDRFYRSIIRAGTFKAPSIKVAEAAKVIENTQRDVNIALINELAQIFHKMGIDTLDVLEAAGTKWNFLPFKPGLVGGHCIGIDPYYITHSAQMYGHDPEIILAGRKINNAVSGFIADKIIKELLARGDKGHSSRVLILGVTFKENCPDCRNSKVVDVIKKLTDFNINVDVYDPVANHEEFFAECGIRLLQEPKMDTYDVITICVGHDKFLKLGIDQIRGYGSENCAVLDVKGLFEKSKVDWRL